MRIDKKIKVEKLQYNINKKTSKIALPSSKIDKYECLTCKEILPSVSSQIIQQAIFTYSPLGTFEKQTKNIKNQGYKQIGAIMNKKEIQLDLIK